MYIEHYICISLLYIRITYIYIYNNNNCHCSYNIYMYVSIYTLYMYAKNHSLCLHLISSTAPGETPHLGEARRGAAEDVGRCHVRRTTKGGRGDVTGMEIPQMLDLDL